MPWFLTPHGPHFVVEPGTIDEYERRDYVQMTAQQVTDYYAGVAFPEPSFATEAEVLPLVTAAVQTGTGALPAALRATFDAWLAENGGAAGDPVALSILRAGLATRREGPVRIVYTGTSLTQSGQYVDYLTAMVQSAYSSGLGTEAAVIDSPTASWGTLSTADGVHSYNAGIGGATSANYLPAENIPRIAALDPAMIVHEVGTNDWIAGLTPATYKANVQARIAALKAVLDKPCVHVLVHTYERWDTFTRVAEWADYGQALREIAAADPDGVVYIDTNPDFVAVGVPGADPFDLVASDLIHQTDAGMRFLADLLGRHLLGSTPSAAPDPVAGPATILSDTFDVDIEGWDGQRSTRDRVTSPVRSGSGALRATATGEGTATAFSAAAPVVMGRTYTATAYVRSGSGALPLNLSILWFDSGFGYIGASPAATATATDSAWTAMTATGSPQVGAAFGIPTIETASSAAAGVAFYVDDFTLTEVAA